MARWISGLILAAVVVALLLLATKVACQAVVVVFAATAAWEYFTMSGAPARNRVFGVVMSVIGVVTLFLPDSSRDIMGFFYAVLAGSFLLPMLDRQATAGGRAQQAAFFALGVLYIVASFGFLGLLFELPHFRFWIFLTLACTLASDTGAYLVGKSFGKNKLAPFLSPGKTVEGFFGGIAGAALGALIVWFLFSPAVPLWKCLLLSGAISVVGVMGDLAESLLKRGFGVKDSGKIIPGHGGVLDRVDAILFTAPFVYLVSGWMQ